MSDGMRSMPVPLTLEQKIGQMMMVGFPGTRLDGDVQALLRDCHIGGVALFSENLEDPWQISQLTAALREHASHATLPPFISVDQEGGSVARLRYPGTVLPSAMAIGATGTARNAFDCALVTARELRALGLNLNFAPVADVNTNAHNPVIGTRSFGDQPGLVASHVVAAIEAHRQCGVLTAAKHFPGHGDTLVDSHLGRPVVTQDRERLRAVEFQPFRAAIEAGVDMVMTGHLVSAALSPASLPATLCRDVLQGALRGELGFNGVIISDALVMDAIARWYGLIEGSLLSISAGVDILLLLGSVREQRRVYEALLEAARDGRIPMDRIDAAVRRIAALKARLQPQVFAPPHGHGDPWPKPEHQLIARAVARQAVTLLRDREHLLPLRPTSSGTVGILDFRTQHRSPVEEPSGASIWELLLRMRCERSQVVMVDAASPGAVEAVDAVVAQSDTIVAATRNALFSPSQAALVRRALRSGKPAAILALRSPYDILAFPEASCYLTTYGDQPCSLEAAAGALFGDFAPAGRLPVRIDGVDDA